MKPQWHYPAVRPDGVQGRGLAEDNFAPEDRTSEEILIREALQNPCDAMSASGGGKIEVRIRLLGPDNVDAAYLQQVLNSDYRSRLEGSTDDPPELNFDDPRLLVIEDFGTTGLLGNFSDSSADGPGENWNAFWFREGEGAKARAGSNGRAGQGKVTYYRSSSARAVFGLTIRDSDSAELLMGRSSLRKNYRKYGVKFERDSFWCLTGPDNHVSPVTDKLEILKFKEALGIERVSEPGLSLVIPFPRDFKVEEALVTVIAEYYYPIVRGRLVVMIGEQLIDEHNIDALANKHLTETVLAKKKSCFTKGFRHFVRTVVKDPGGKVGLAVLKPGWEKKTFLGGDDFSQGVMEDLKLALENGERVSVRCPIKIKPKKGPAVESSFDVHLQVPDGLEQCEEAYVRRDLLIGAEKHLSAGAPMQYARGLTEIQDVGISAFMADAEEPTHLKWNASRPRLADDYQAPKDVVRAVRQALPRLLACLSGGKTRRDLKALAKFFSKPSLEPTAVKNIRKTDGTSRQETTSEDSVVPPLPVIRKPLRVDTGDNWVRVLPNGAAAPSWESIPMECTLEAAYDGLDLNPFESYDPFDFDFGDKTSFIFESEGLEIKSRALNKIEFEVSKPEFSLTIVGFDPNVRLLTKVTYAEATKEVENGPDNDTE